MANAAAAHEKAVPLTIDNPSFGSSVRGFRPASARAIFDALRDRVCLAPVQAFMFRFPSNTPPIYANGTKSPEVDTLP
jgi:hypothetical protein